MHRSLSGQLCINSQLTTNITFQSSLCSRNDQHSIRISRQLCTWTGEKHFKFSAVTEGVPRTKVPIAILSVFLKMFASPVQNLLSLLLHLNKCLAFSKLQTKDFSRRTAQQVSVVFTDSWCEVMAVVCLLCVDLVKHQKQRDVCR